MNGQIRLGRFPRWLLLVGGIVPAACAGTGAGPVATPSPLLDPASAEMTQPPPPAFKVLFETTQGDFVVEAREAWAPEGVRRFYNLVRHGYFDDVYFFRVLPGFVAQFGIHGDPEVTAAWRASPIDDDPVEGSNVRGTITFATAGPDTRTVQLFINLADNQRLDASGFAPIGGVSGGMDVVGRLYGGYGEGAPGGQGPDQTRMQQEGNAYLESQFPLLDRIIRARLLEP